MHGDAGWFKLDLPKVQQEEGREPRGLSMPCLLLPPVTCACPLSPTHTHPGKEVPKTSGVVPRQPVHLQDEVVLEKEEAHDGEEVDKDEGQQGSQQDGAAIAGHTLDDIKQRLLSVDEVKELQGQRLHEPGPSSSHGLCQQGPSLQRSKQEASLPVKCFSH